MGNYIEIVVPNFKWLTSPDERKIRIIVVFKKEKFGVILKNILECWSVEISENIDSIYLSLSNECSCMILLVNQNILLKIEETLKRLKEKNVVFSYHIIEPIEKIIPIKNVILIDENFTRLRIIPQQAFIGIFANLYSILGNQAELVIERLGYYYGRSFSEYIQKNLAIDKPDVVKFLQYTLITGVSLGLFSLIDVEVKTHVLSNTTDLIIKVKDYYEEEGYFKLGMKKCGLFQQGFYKGVIEYSLGEAKYEVREPVCYNEEKISIFVISLPFKIGKIEKNEFLRLKKALAI